MLVAQGHELQVRGLGRALAVIAGDLGDQLDLTVGESLELIAVADHVVRVPVVRRVADEEAHVVEEAGSLEQVAVVEVELVDGGGGVEDLERQVGGSLNVADVLVVHLRHAEDRLPADVAQVVEAGRADGGSPVEEDPLPQRGLRHRHLLDGQTVEDLLEQHHAGDDDVLPPVVESGNPGSVIGARDARDGVHYTREGVAADDLTVGRGRRITTRRGDRHPRNGVDGARAADRHERAELANSSDGGH